ncbi:hypothetical protein Taro_053016 [Colocasia esculenta]|uniref:Uncharacterized protein n=1 Tax=Colocasia esculenta TaxID=4460 RepID=A0A843XLD4_COLES|nr:hypothetical protein [Colocasia esculenta]
MVVPKKGTRALLARPCRVVFRWLAFQQGPSVSYRRVLLLLLAAHAASVVAGSLVLRLGSSSACASMWNGALVVLVEVLPELVCVASPVCCVLSVGRLFGLRSGDGSQNGSWGFGWRSSPSCLVLYFVCHCSLSVEMSYRRCWLDCPCYSLPWCCRPRCGALIVCLALVLARFSFCSFVCPRPCWWDFVCPHGQEVCSISRTLWALPDGSLVSAMGVWLVVLLWKCQSRLVVSPCVWKTLIVSVLLPCFPLVARGGGAFTWHLVPCRAPWRPLWQRSLPLCCLEVELVPPLVHVVSLWCDRLW